MISVKNNHCYLSLDGNANINNNDTFPLKYGAFLLDTRHLSIYDLKLNDFTLMASTISEHNKFQQNWQQILKRGDTSINIARNLMIDNNNFSDSFKIYNYTDEIKNITLELEIGTDFADMFALRLNLDLPANRVITSCINNEKLHFNYTSADNIKASTIVKSNIKPQDIIQKQQHLYKLVWNMSLGAFENKELIITSAFTSEHSILNTVNIPSLQQWHKQFEQPALSQLHKEIYNRSVYDIYSLLNSWQEGFFVSAGVPRFVTPFGRDSLLVSLMLLKRAPKLALGTLKILAQNQGRETNNNNEEEAGKIPHELRFGEACRLGLAPFTRYYGGSDQTSLFILLFCRYYEQTNDAKLLKELLPNLQQALEFIEKQLVIGKGFISFKPKNNKGLLSQSWKDSADAMMHKDGQLGTPPLAVVEVQGYTCAALLEASKLYKSLNNEKVAEYYRNLATDLQQKIDNIFWQKELNNYALAYEIETKKTLNVQTSNSGHLLFCNIVPKEKASKVAQTMFSHNMMSRWGIRTLGQYEKAYNPGHYHNGSVWAFDNVLAMAGFYNYGLNDYAKKIFEAIYKTAQNCKDFRIPELVMGSNDFASTITPLNSSSPQAWSASALIYATELYNNNKG